ncbi:hypothetical protein [Arthrobacter sp. NEB 688]|uniref:hypothetical protein n=1 Tax=Arthrobacter sp. NEB 688 TaxID=904039 RepID=UPI0015671F04|nr:hypothetical protein [Arthrobacter sp. NEB 688]QKE85552.1 hypothetical protein HL663_17550 [Arthrobacter sp. NEB 688]
MGTRAAGDGVRLMRALVATLVVIGLGAAAHAMAGGAPLQPVPVVVLLVVVAPVVHLVVRRRTSLARMVLATALGQLLTHLLLTAMTPAAAGTGRRLHAHEAVAMAMPTTGSASASSLTGGMLAAHAVATLLAAVLLTRGADALELLALALLRLARPASPGTGPLGRPVDLVEVRVPDGRVVGPLGGRAPPLLLV